jgi:hypothetical protein
MPDDHTYVVGEWRGTELVSTCVSVVQTPRACSYSKNLDQRRSAKAVIAESNPALAAVRN